METPITATPREPLITRIILYPLGLGSNLLKGGIGIFHENSNSKSLLRLAYNELIVVFRLHIFPIIININHYLAVFSTTLTGADNPHLFQFIQ